MKETKTSDKEAKKIHVISSFDENNKRKIMDARFGKKIGDLLYTLVGNPDCLFYFEEEFRIGMKRDGKIYFVELKVIQEGLKEDG